MCDNNKRSPQSCYCPAPMRAAERDGCTILAAADADCSGGKHVIITLFNIFCVPVILGWAVYITEQK